MLSVGTPLFKNCKIKYQALFSIFAVALVATNDRCTLYKLHSWGNSEIMSRLDPPLRDFVPFCTPNYLAINLLKYNSGISILIIKVHFESKLKQYFNCIKWTLISHVQPKKNYFLVKTTAFSFFSLTKTTFSTLH